MIENCQTIDELIKRLMEETQFKKIDPALIAAMVQISYYTTLCLKNNKVISGS